MPSPRSNPRPKPNSPEPPSPLAHFDFEAIGTQWAIDLYDPPTDPEAILRAIRDRIDTFDRHYSRFRPDSLVTAMSQSPGAYELPPDAKPLFDLYHDLYRLTGGAVTPLIGDLISDAGYDAGYSLTPRPLSRPPAWDEALHYDFPRLTLKQPALLDVGAAGKGYLVDLIAKVLTDHRLTAYTIDAGGDILHHRPTAAPLRIGLEHPDDPTQAIGVATLQSGSLCGSAPNRRRWAGYHHILDPRTLAPTKHISAVWTTARSARLADALATALFFVPATTLATHYAFDYAIVHADYSLEHSRAFPATFFTPTETS